MNALVTTLAAVALFALFLVLERFFPLRKGTRSFIVRLVVNIAVSALTFLAAMTLVQPAAQWALRWSTDQPFGLVHLLPLPGWFEFVLSFLLMDLAFYYWHLVNHRIPFLWRFHNVHHTDPELDVSTAFRFHFGEIAFSSGFSVIQISLIGISPWAFAAYQLVFQSEVLFHHSNLRLPIRLEWVLSKLLVTPRMHGIHRSQVQRENNSNFGTAFPWWDRLHRTLGLNIPQREIVIGIPGYSLPEDNTVPNAPPDAVSKAARLLAHSQWHSARARKKHPGIGSGANGRVTTGCPQSPHAYGHSPESQRRRSTSSPLGKRHAQRNWLVIGRPKRVVGHVRERSLTSGIHPRN